MTTAALPLFASIEPPPPPPPDKHEIGQAFDATLTAIRHQPAGTVTVYHAGNLPKDRQRSAEVCGKAAAYLEASSFGLVILTQRRVGAERYEYRAHRTATKNREPRA